MANNGTFQPSASLKQKVCIWRCYAATTQNFLALEHHSVDMPWWESIVKTADGRKLIEKGYANVPLEAPGLGIELVDEEVKKHLTPKDKSYFAPTDQRNDKRLHDRLWS